MEKREAPKVAWEPMRLEDIGDLSELVLGGEGKSSIPASTDPSSSELLKKPPGQSA